MVLPLTAHPPLSGSNMEPHGCEARIIWISLEFAACGFAQLHNPITEGEGGVLLLLLLLHQEG